MSNGKKIILAIAIVLILGLMVSAYFTNGSNGTVPCTDGCMNGIVKCGDCSGTGILVDEESGEVSACESCKASVAECDICMGYRLTTDEE